jgi:hypothetical protein
MPSASLDGEKEAREREEKPTTKAVSLRALGVAKAT